MPDWIEAPLTTLAFCWRLERRDGIVLGFTSHDHDLERDGFLYRAAPGMVPSAIEHEAGFPSAMLDVSGVLSDSAISAADLEAGRWDGASMTLFATDWSDAQSAPLVLALGMLGRIERRGQAFTAELRGPADLLDRIAVPHCSPGCRASLGDRRCGVDLRGKSRLVTVVQVSGLRIETGEALQAGIYASGSVRPIDGPGAGLRLAVAANDAAGLDLAAAPRMAITPGTRMIVTEGCDRRFETCTSRFGNVINFRGEPHVPGNDLLLRYAG